LYGGTHQEEKEAGRDRKKADDAYPRAPGNLFGPFLPGFSPPFC